MRWRKLSIPLAIQQLVLASIVFLLVGGGARADVVLEQSFDDLPDGDLPMSQSSGSVWQWHGPDGAYGSIKITGEKFAGDKGKSAAFFCSSSQINESLVLNADWSSKLSSNATLKNSVEWAAMAPKEGSLLGLCFVGNDWRNSVAIVILQSGKISLEYGAGERLSLGEYQAGKWNSFKVVSDPTSKTFDVFVNDQQMVKGYAWRKEAQYNLGHLTITAGTSNSNQNDVPVLYVDNIKAGTLP